MFLRHLVVCIFLFIILRPYSVQAQPPDFEQRIAGFENYIESERARKNIAGLSVALEYKDFRWAKGYGFADLENQVPASPVSSYRMASITKPMTAIGILLLVEEGKIDLDAEVQKYVPYFPRKKWPVTIRYLLGHLAGISHYKNYDEECNTTEQMTTQEAISIFSEWDLLHQPGTKYQYTTYGYNLLGAVIEGASGEKYEDFMRRRVWQPLSMETTQLDHLFRLIANRVEGYRVEEGEYVNVRPVNTSLKFAGGGTRATVLDLLNFAQGLSAGTVLPQQTMDIMWTSMVTSDSLATGYGMGWSVMDFNGRFAVGHGGGQEGTRTFIFHIPRHDITIAIASNLETTNPYEVATHLAAVLLDEPVRHPILYTGSWHNDKRQKVLDFCFRDGMAYYDRYKKADDENSPALKSAFEFCSRMLGENIYSGLSPDSASKIIETGRHPVTDWSYRAVGSFMTQTIVNTFGQKKLDTLYGSGALAFFKIYDEALSSKKDVLPHIAMEPTAMRQINIWREIEQKTWTEEIQDIQFTPASNATDISAQLNAVFAGYDMYPDLTEGFGRVVLDAVQAKNGKRAREFAQTSYNFYPESEEAVFQLGIVEIIQGYAERGKKYLQQSLKINPTGSAYQGNLNFLAYRLASWDQVDAGLNVLKAAVDLNPQVANLYDSTGELYLMKGDTTQSIAFYNKALEIDPEFENAQNMLKKITGKKK